METTGKAKLITTTHVKPINELNTIIKLVINTNPNGRYPPQSRVHMEKINHGL